MPSVSEASQPLRRIEPTRGQDAPRGSDPGTIPPFASSTADPHRRPDGAPCAPDRCDASSPRLAEQAVAPQRRADRVSADASPDVDVVDAVIDREHRSSQERRLALARVIGAVVLVVVMSTGSGPFHPREATLVTAAYAVFSAAILLLFQLAPSAAAAAGVPIHLGDLAWATAATAVSGGVSSHTFTLFLFVLAASAYRWSMPGSLCTGGVVMAIAAGEALASRYGYLRWPFELDTFLLLSSYVAVFAVLFGLLSDRLHARAAQAIVAGRILQRIARARGICAALDETLGELVTLFHAREAAIVLREAGQDAVYLWSGRRGAPGTVTVCHRELRRSEHEAAILAVPAGARIWEFRQPARAGALPDAVALTVSGAAGSTPLSVPGRLPGISSWRSLIVMAVDLPGCWAGRLYLADATRPGDAVLRLALLHKVVHHVTPALASFYLLRRLRSRAEATERGRIARELHDGVIQTLAVVDLRLELARRRAAAADPALAADLDTTRELVRDDGMNLRDLIQRLRPADVDSASLPRELRDRLERFSAMTGIEAQLRCAADPAELTRHQCQEIVRIVQEALVNVRRHSGASHVLVRLAADASACELIVEDNGRGFGFDGRLAHEQLERRREGPLVIRERAASLGGTLAVESSRTGARLQIVFPLLRVCR